MAVGLVAPDALLPVSGVRVGVAKAHIKKPDRRDLVVFEFVAGSVCAATFTTNAFCAAPVIVAKEHLAKDAPRYLLINTGNANAGTGARGIGDARKCCDAVAAKAECVPSQVLPFSTGVIGEFLPVDRIVAGLDAAFANLTVDGWVDAAHGIMTTDTLPKGVSRRFEIDGNLVTITGISKGSGMIAPNMATMLGFIATDAKIENTLLQTLLRDAVSNSFNRIVVDGDMSTNDACVLAATGASGVDINRTYEAAYSTFAQALNEVCLILAQAIVRDGEGVTKFVTLDISGAATLEECELVARAIGTSPLVKTALFASDPNWGRILAAIGRAGLSNLNVDGVMVFLDDVCIVRDGMRAQEYIESAGQTVMNQPEITVGVKLGRGPATAKFWTCDFSYDYVKINAEYRT